MTTKNAVGNSLTGSTGSGAFVGATSPTLITPALGTPASGTLTNCTGYPQKVVQQVYTQTGSYATGTTIIPADNTTPQNTEGTEFMTLAITPQNSSNILRISVVLIGAYSVLSYSMAALFQDSTANALASAFMTLSATYAGCFTFTHTMAAGTTSSTTFKLRAGGSNAGTFYFNGNAGALLNSTLASSITITEFTP